MTQHVEKVEVLDSVLWFLAGHQMLRLRKEQTTFVHLVPN